MAPRPPQAIAKVQRYCRYARTCCLVLFLLLAVMGPIGIVMTLLTVDFDFYLAWPSIGLIGLGRLVEFGFVAVAVAYLYALFGDLGRGVVHTAANVRRTGRVGALLMALGGFEVVMPVLTAVLLRTGIVPPEAVSYLPTELWPKSLLFVLVGSLIVLVSWILDVGRQATEDAERLRSEAELTV